MALTRFKPHDFDHWLCRLVGRHVRYTIIGQTCSEPEWTAQCEVCDRHGDLFIPTVEDLARFDTHGLPRCFSGWFL
jgi:hypothetical protein